jgi:hypothetical protein
VERWRKNRVEASIVHAGVGEHRAAARGAHYFDTDKGRLALISLASTFTPLSRSAPPVGEAPGRPGVNALRTTPMAESNEGCEVIHRVGRGGREGSTDDENDWRVCHFRPSRAAASRLDSVRSVSTS